MKPAVFIDKDGTLVEDVPFNVDPAKLRLAPGVREGLRRLGRQNVPVFIVTNQPGFAIGRFGEDEFFRLCTVLRWMFAEHGCVLTGIYHCPHLPQGRVRPYAVDCDCRKPKDGLLRRAAGEHRIDLPNSWMIGDILNDVEAGHRAGCRTVFIDNGNETEWRRGPLREPDATVSRFDEAVNLVCEAMSPEAVHVVE